MARQSPFSGKFATPLLLASVVLGMAGLTYASVPFYRWFCQTTGFAGTPQRVETNAAPAGTTAGGRRITVRFDANVSNDLPWAFDTDQRAVVVELGETQTITYHARNLTAHALTGTATFNVTPEKAAAYFDKIACFCFSEQGLRGGEQASLPVTFFVDPALASDPNLADVSTITLSYTFFRAKTPSPIADTPAPRATASPPRS